jgi:RNA polymerase sigma-70 factor (ECF subfamily)
MGDADIHREGLAQLLRQLQKTHDRRILGVVVERTTPYVFWYAYLITGELHAAEDLTQEVFLTLTRAYDQIREPGKLLAWLRKVTGNHVKLVRRGARERPSSDLLLDLTAFPCQREKLPFEALLEAEGRAELAKQLDTALRNLTPAERRCLELLYWKGLKAPDVAERMGVKPSTIHRYHSVALKKLFSMGCLED